MKCPNDASTLLITERQGIEIDYCPECRGVWLDRGELDKFIEKADSAYSQQPKREYHEPTQAQHQDSLGYNKKHRKESFLGDIFDF